MRRLFIRTPLITFILFTTFQLNVFPDGFEGEAPKQYRIEDIVIVINAEPGPESAACRQIAERLIYLRKGRQFSVQLLEKSIDALKMSNRFEEIAIDSRGGEETITLIFQLTPSRRIMDIRVRGESPLFEHEILDAMTVYVGGTVNAGDVIVQEELVEEMLRREGFFDPAVSLTLRRASSEGHVIVFVDVDKGPYYLLERLDIMGNHAFSDAELKRKMKVWRSKLSVGSLRRFRVEDVEADREKLIRLYRKKGYPDPAVAFRIDRRPSDRKSALVFTIEEGPRYDTRFTGNKHFSGRTLRKDLSYIVRGTGSDPGFRRSISGMRKRYRAAGYDEVAIHAQKTSPTGGGDSVAVVFSIDEGPRTTVKSMDISGNRLLSDRRIKKQMLTKEKRFFRRGVYVRDNLEKDIATIDLLYREQGHLAAGTWAEIEEYGKTQNTVSIRINVNEDVRSIVSSVALKGLTVIEEEHAFEELQLKEGEPFRRHLLQSDENTLSLLVSRMGHPHVTVDAELRFSDDQSEVSILYVIDEGPYVELRSVYYAGNFRTREKILQRELEIGPGEPLSPSKLLRGERNIRNMDILESARFMPVGLGERMDRVDLFIEVVEKNPFFVELGGGYESDRGLFINARGGDRNVFGRNKYAWIGGGLSQIGYRGQMGFTEPQLFGSYISADLGLYAERRREFNQDFGTSVFGASLGFKRKQLRYLTTGLGFSYEMREKFIAGSERTEDVYGVGEIGRRSIFIISPTVLYDTRDSALRPKKGSFSMVSVDISMGMEDAADDFIKYFFDQRLFFTPIDPITFALLGRIGHIDPYGAVETVPEDQLFFLGGTSDVRGFKENLLFFDEEGKPAGGTTAVSGSLETRLGLWGNIEGTVFFDTGILSNDLFKNTSPFRSSIGVGMRYITAIGPIGLLYGMKLKPKEDEAFGRFHLSMGYTF